MDLQRVLNDAANAGGKEIDSARLAGFLTGFAALIENRKSEIVDAAHKETNLPKSPRLSDVELPRTTGQLRQAAAAALEGSWSLPTIDSKLNIRSRLAPLGPIFILGPNNFPLAFNSIGGGDFAAAIAAGNPVIARAHPGYVATTKLLFELAQAAATQAELPPNFIQLIEDMTVAQGLQTAADSRIGATAFTGSRKSGLALKAAADAAGKPIYLEMSSINPVVILPGALAERSEKIADEFADSCLAASGQFCTNPGLVLLIDSEPSEHFVDLVKGRFQTRPGGTYLSPGVAQGLNASLKTLQGGGAQVVCGGSPPANTLVRVSGDEFLMAPNLLQTEAFGNASLFVMARNLAQAAEILHKLEGNLTGCIYSGNGDEPAYQQLSPILRSRVGRLLNDKMPTGVAVSPAMNHGGPFPATGHPGFTAVGIPASLRRFARLECFDNIRDSRLPSALANKNPNSKMWRSIDGEWTRADVPAHQKGLER